VVSNELDEAIIEHLVASGAPIDLWGVGTNLVTGGDEAAFTGVYKLSAIRAGAVEKPVMKFSDNPEKSTDPGRKLVYRLYSVKDAARLDLIALEEEKIEPGREILVHHPSGDYRHLSFAPFEVEPLLKPVMAGGKRLKPSPSLEESKAYCTRRLESFDATYLRQLNPHVYKVSISDKLRDTKLGLLRRYLKKY